MNCIETCSFPKLHLKAFEICHFISRCTTFNCCTAKEKKKENKQASNKTFYDNDCCLRVPKYIYNTQSTRPQYTKGVIRFSTTNDYYLPKKMLSC